MANETENIVHVTTNTWEKDVLRSDKPVLVDFLVGPALEQLSKTLNGKIKVVKLNVDENQEIAMKYGIQSIPSLLLYKEGQEIGRTIGAASKEAYQRFVEQTLSNPR